MTTILLKRIQIETFQFQTAFYVFFVIFEPKYMEFWNVSYQHAREPKNMSLSEMLASSVIFVKEEAQIMSNYL